MSWYRLLYWICYQKCDVYFYGLCSPRGNSISQRWCWSYMNICLAWCPMKKCILDQSPINAFNFYVGNISHCLEFFFPWVYMKIKTPFLCHWLDLHCWSSACLSGKCLISLQFWGIFLVAWWEFVLQPGSKCFWDGLDFCVVFAIMGALTQT